MSARITHNRNFLHLHTNSRLRCHVQTCLSSLHTINCEQTNTVALPLFVSRVDASSRSSLEGWRQEAQEEELHYSEEEQAQA